MSNLYWLGRPALAMASVILVHVWRLLPLAAVIFIAGMNSIPKEIEEQAMIDGCSRLGAVRRILLPLLCYLTIQALYFFTFFS